MNKIFNCWATLVILLILLSCNPQEKENTTKLLSVDIQEESNTYFSINGKPTLLIGGSNNDNIFQDHPVEPQLDTLVKYGGNLIRCTLSSRDFANQWPYQQRADALYDLNNFSDAYWNRLDKFLKITQEKGIIVQLEIWDTRDFRQANNWAKHPFNPEYNINYGEESGLPLELANLSTETPHPFFKTISPKNTIVLPFQEKFVEKLLSVSLPYQHILYCINNEFIGDIDWSIYWYNFMSEHAKAHDKDIIIGDMPGNLQHLPNIQNWTNSKTFDFLDLSMIALNTKSYHTVIDSVKSIYTKPVSLIKIFGGEQYDFTGTIEQGPQRFWESVFTKAASVRFHQPPQGAGLNRLAQVNLKSLSMLNEQVAFTSLIPNNNALLNREAEEAYCLSDLEKQQFLIYYPGCGEVQLKLPNKHKKATVRWLNILNAQWEETYDIENQEIINLKSPCEGKWAVYVQFI